jgi:hypothetical protein
MEKIITGYHKTKEQVEQEKNEAKILIESAFQKIREIGITIDVPSMGHAVLNPEKFLYYHKDEIYHLNYKVQL